MGITDTPAVVANAASQPTVAQEMVVEVPVMVSPVLYNASPLVPHSPRFGTQAPSPIVTVPYGPMIAPPPQFSPHVAAYSPALQQRALPQLQVLTLSNSQGILPPPHSPTYMQGTPSLTLSSSQSILRPASPTFVVPTPISSSHPPLVHTTSQGTIVHSPSHGALVHTLSNGTLNHSLGVPAEQVSSPGLTLARSQSFGPAIQASLPQSPTLASSQEVGNPLTRSGSFGPQFVPQPTTYQIPSSVLANPFVMTTLSLAQRFNISVRWKRTMDVTVHGARELTHKNKDGINDAKCKLSIEGQVGMTKIIKKSATPTWEETFKFKVHKPCNLTVAIYNHNVILSDDELGRITVAPHQLVEGAKVSMGFPVHPKGELNMTIGLSTPWPDNFRFVLSHNFFSFGDFHIQDSNGANVFLIEGNWPSDFYFKDMTNVELLHIKRRTLITLSPTFDIYAPNQEKPLLTVTKQLTFGGGTFQIVGPNGVLRVEGDVFNWNYKFIDATNRCVAFVENHNAGSMNNAYIVEVAPDQDIPLFLACAMVIGKTIHKR